MRDLIDAVGLKCHDEEKAVVFFKLALIFGGVLSLNAQNRDMPLHVFHNKCRAEAYHFVGSNIPGTKQTVTKEMVDAMFKYTDLEGYYTSKK